MAQRGKLARRQQVHERFIPRRWHRIQGPRIGCSLTPRLRHRDVHRAERMPLVDRQQMRREGEAAPLLPGRPLWSTNSISADVPVAVADAVGRHVLVGLDEEIRQLGRCVPAPLTPLLLSAMIFMVEYQPALASG
jgi:hypothetical protein